jgi:signal transduction histidine kinase
MDDGLRSGLLLFALVTLLSAVPIVLRRLRPALLAAVHALGLVVVLAMVACAALERGDARPLLLPYLVGLTLGVLGAAGPAGRKPVPRALARSGLVIGLAGVGATAATLFSRTLPSLLTPALALVAVGFGGGAAWSCLVRARGATTGADRRADLAAALACAVAAGAVGLALVVEGPRAAAWAPWLALAAALATSVRVPPFVPPTAREGVAALFVGLALLFADTAGPDVVNALLRGLEAGLVTLGVLAASRALLVPRARAPEAKAAPVLGDPGAPPLLAEAALAHMSPMLDDGLLFRPPRPRVNARVTARRLLEASLERARAAGPPGRRSLGVEVREDDADVDVEGDPGELAEALCAVLDNALRLKQRHPTLSLRVHVRGSPSHVTFEVEDDLARQLEGEPPGASFAPFTAAHDGDPPGVGVALSRAKLLVERHGGVLLARRTADGSCVQLTVPRRRVRNPLGLA